MDNSKLKIVAGALALICVISIFISIRCILSRNKLSKQDLAAIKKLNAIADEEIKKMAEDDF